jgi:hypothetical protein
MNQEETGKGGTREGAGKEPGKQVPLIGKKLVGTRYWYQGTN